MLNTKTRTLVHPLFGKVYFDERFSKILDMPCFFNLRYLSQLGCLQFSPEFIAANRNRIQHSVGVYAIMQNLLYKLEHMYSLEFQISSIVKDALLLAALGHDLGHRPFSHVLERREQISHEERSIQIFIENRNEINEIFGYDIVSLVIIILGDDINCNSKSSSDYITCNVLKKLLDGPIDCDRMEYIRTDWWTLFGEDIDFQSIFDYLKISFHYDEPIISYNYRAISNIKDFLITRKKLYLDGYYSEKIALPEMVLRIFQEDYLMNNGINISYLSEPEIISILIKLLKEENVSTTQRRFAEIIYLGSRSNILFKRFENHLDFEQFLKAIRSIIPQKYIFTLSKSLSIYNGGILIENKDGSITDFAQVCNLPNPSNISLDYLLVDLELVGSSISSTDIDYLHNLFGSTN